MNKPEYEHLYDLHKVEEYIRFKEQDPSIELVSVLTKGYDYSNLPMIVSFDSLEEICSEPSYWDKKYINAAKLIYKHFPDTNEVSFVVY